AAGPEGPRHRADRLRLDGRQSVREHEARLGGARGQAAPRGVFLSHCLWPGDAEVCAVIMINLLPHREERRRRKKIAFFAGVAVAAVVGAAVVGVWYLA